MWTVIEGRIVYTPVLKHQRSALGERNPRADVVTHFNRQSLKGGDDE